jgi:hypothetical protein
MSSWRALIVSVIVVVALGLGCHSSCLARPSFRLISPTGKVIISEADLQQYQWATHTMVLKEGTVKRLCSELPSTAPFFVQANGATCYEGQFVSQIISASFSCPVIKMPGLWREREQLPDTLSITLGYPTQEWFRGTDPRGDPRILEALEALGKVER